MTSTTRTRTKPAPPAAAVAADPHWNATLERLRNRQRPVVHIRICDDQDAKVALLEAMRAKARLEAAEGTTAADLKKATDDVTAAQANVSEATITLGFQALDRKSFKALLAEHRPTEEQAEDGYDYNPDTLGPVLIAASSMDGITEEDARFFLEDWAQAEGEGLLNTVFNVQHAERMELGKG